MRVQPLISSNVNTSRNTNFKAQGVAQVRDTLLHELEQGQKKSRFRQLIESLLEKIGDNSFFRYLDDVTGITRI